MAKLEDWNFRGKQDKNKMVIFLEDVSIGDAIKVLQLIESISSIESASEAAFEPAKQLKHELTPSEGLEVLRKIGEERKAKKRDAKIKTEKLEIKHPEITPIYQDGHDEITHKLIKFCSSPTAHRLELIKDAIRDKPMTKREIAMKILASDKYKQCDQIMKVIQYFRNEFDVYAKVPSGNRNQKAVVWMLKDSDSKKLAEKKDFKNGAIDVVKVKAIFDNAYKENTKTITYDDLVMLSGLFNMSTDDFLHSLKADEKFKYQLEEKCGYTLEVMGDELAIVGVTTESAFGEDGDGGDGSA